MVSIETKAMRTPGRSLPSGARAGLSTACCSVRLRGEQSVSVSLSLVPAVAAGTIRTCRVVLRVRDMLQEECDRNQSPVIVPERTIGLLSAVNNAHSSRWNRDQEM